MMITLATEKDDNHH